MNTTGKSDIFEATIQMLILKSLHERGSDTSSRLVQDVRRKARGISGIDQNSVYLALRKLEASGWIRKHVDTRVPNSGTWNLTVSATRCLPIEMRQWKVFVEGAPRIFSLLQSDFDRDGPTVSR